METACVLAQNGRRFGTKRKTLHAQYALRNMNKEQKNIIKGIIYLVKLKRQTKKDKERIKESGNKYYKKRGSQVKSFGFLFYFTCI